MASTTAHLHSPSWASSNQAWTFHPISWKSIFINFPLCLGPQLGSFPQVSPHKPYIQLSYLLYALHDTPYLILLVFFTQTILCEEYRSLSSSLCSFLRYLVISFHLDPNILLNNLSNTLSRRSYQISATMFQNHMKKQAKFYFCIS